MLTEDWPSVRDNDLRQEQLQRSAVADHCNVGESGPQCNICELLRGVLRSTFPLGGANALPLPPALKNRNDVSSKLRRNMCLCDGHLAATWLCRCHTAAASQEKHNAIFAISWSQLWDRLVVPIHGTSE